MLTKLVQIMGCVCLKLLYIKHLILSPPPLQLPPPSSDSFTIVGANQDQFQGNYVIRDSQYPLSSSHLVQSSSRIPSDRVTVSLS